MELARNKALSVCGKAGYDDIVLGVDTIVYIDKTILGKPTDQLNARKMIQMLSGRMHSVISGVCLISKKGFETIFEGYKAFALNLGLCNSEYFKSVDNGTYDLLMPFSFDGDEWIISLYSRNIDVSEIAKKYGGGGHKGAAGFHCKELPFKKYIERRK